VGSGRRELPAYLSNGLIGLRVRDVPLSAGMTLLNGYTGEHPVRKIEAAAVAPYPLAADIAIDNVWLSDVPHQVRDLEQSYDFACAELATRFTFEACGRVAAIEVLTFCSRAEPTLACQEIAVDLDGACDLGLRATIDAAQCDGHALKTMRSTPGEDQPAVDGALLWESAGALARCGLALVSEVRGAGDQEPSRRALSGNRLTSEYRLRARAGRRVRLRQMVSLIPHVMHRQPDHQATRLAAKARKDGFETIRHANREAWAALWRSRIVLKGADAAWQALTDAAVFYLNTSVHPSSSASTSIFGLATWHDYHYYFGHVMWDIEAFAVAPLSLLQPPAARALLDYRTRRLAGARRNAQLLGRRGLQFPWESAPASGEEATPMPGASAWHEDHVSLDVAHAFWRFACVTGDLEFLRGHAWPVLSGVADWLTSRVTKTAQGYDFTASMGIAEREAPVNNAAFTNMAAVVVLGDAILAAERLGLSPPREWALIRDTLAIPKRGAAIVSHDNFRTNEEKGATPDPLMGLFPFGFPIDPEGEAATLALYLGLADAYVGSPMLSALYGAWAARTGDRQLALRLLDEGYARFCVGRFTQTLEYRPDRFPEQPQAGPFFANIGGFLTSLLFGFTGIEPNAGEPETWFKRPVTLPVGWTAIEIDRVWIRGRPMRLTAAHGAPRAELTPLSGEMDAI
jgi:trehalose/maltose hydrolase-like predicted phosphorylase